jgi:protein-S-isoprenylcysteine O-methyltransferase Ste14
MLKVFIIILQVLGWLIFCLATVVLGTWLRKHPSKTNAEITSRALHLLFWASVAPPTGFGFVYPGLTRYDEVLGIPSLSRFPVFSVAGSLGLLSGICLICISSVSLWLSGKGANAILLTQQLAKGNIYKLTRNPMSLGLYLSSVGMGLLVGSTYLTCAALLGVIPVHVFYLKYFEELELALRMGKSYLAYKQEVPFLLPRRTSPHHE